MSPRPIDWIRWSSTPLLHEEASHGLSAPLAQLDVVRAITDAVRVALQLDHQVRILLELLGELEQRRLPAVVEVRAVEAEEDGDGLAGDPLVAVRPEAGQPSAGLVRLGVGLRRARMGLVGTGLGLAGLGHALVGAGLGGTGEGGRLGGLAVDLLDRDLGLAQLIGERRRAGALLGDRSLDAPDVGAELRLALADLLANELLRRASGGDDRQDGHQDGYGTCPHEMSSSVRVGPAR